MIVKFFLNLGKPVEVSVTMFVISISSVSEVQMDFTSDFYFRQYWRDNRLSFPPTNGITQIFVGAEVSERIWVNNFKLIHNSFLVTLF